MFRSFQDTIDRIKGYSEGQRFAMAMKGLVDQYGALTSERARKQFAQQVERSLGVEGFVAEALKLGVLKADAEFIAIPAARMVGPLLFKSLDTDSISYKRFKRFDRYGGLSRSQLRNILTSSTRNLVLFGKDKVADPNSGIAKITLNSDRSFSYVNEELERQVELTVNGKNGDYGVERTNGVDQSTEAVIKAVEASGALGVRSLQLARQLYRFSPKVDARLAKSFDANRGLNKLLFWENLEKITTQEGNGAAAFVENSVDYVDEFLGGGSLYTTFSAQIRTPDGEVKTAVVKMLNPNPELFIGTSYKTSVDVLDEIAQGKNGQNANLAKLGRAFVDLSQEWCLKDINDSEFEADDDDFQQTVTRFNRQENSETFYVPKRFLTTYRLKSEERAPGYTLNKVLASEDVESSVKAELVQKVEDLFAYQLELSARQGENSEDVYLVHSDPHIGNYVVDLKGESPRIGVIDRSMYLKLNGKQAAMFRDLLKTGDYQKFVNPFIEEVMNANKLVNPNLRDAKKNRVVGALRREYVKQKAGSIIRRRDMDNLALLRRFMSELTAAGLQVPLEMRLMIRNVEAFRELGRRYGKTADS